MNPDITTDEGKEQAKSGSSALSRYLQEMHDYQKDVMEKLYASTIDRPCTAVCELDETNFFTVSWLFGQTQTCYCIRVRTRVYMQLRNVN